MDPRRESDQSGPKTQAADDVLQQKMGKQRGLEQA
jgi:hypothetical protein